MDKIAVLIPCYNEGKTIRRVVKEFKEVLPEATVYVYDNNSTDNTISEAKAAGAVIRHEPVQGKGNVIRRMFREVDAECYVMCDGDHTYDASDAPEMASLVLSKNYDMVIADRLTGGYREENARRFHTFGNDLVRMAIRVLFKAKLSDVMSGYRAFSYNFVKTFPVMSSGFTIETEMSIHALDKRMAITSVSGKYIEREAGSVSKLNTIQDGIRVLNTIGRLFFQYRPFLCMLFFAMILWLVSGGILLSLCLEYCTAGSVRCFFSLIASGLMILTGIQMVLSGLILQNRARHDRQEFEIRLLSISGNRHCEPSHD